MNEPSEVVFNGDTYTLLLSVNPDDFNVPKYVSKHAEQEGLIKKEELHITILGFAAGRKIAEVLSIHQEKRGKFMDMVNNLRWSFEPKLEFYSIRKSYSIKGVSEERQSVIMMVNVV